MKKKLFAFAIVGTLAYMTSPLGAATYTCVLNKVQKPHPYLPEKVVFTTDQWFREVTFTDVQIKNVTAPVTVGEVVNRAPARVRIKMPATEYVLVGPRPPRSGTFGSYSPAQYDFNLSLRRSDSYATVRVVDSHIGYSYGSVEGPCQVSK